MLFFRSEEQVRRWCEDWWCEDHGNSVGPLVSMDQLWKLATTWYSTRLREDSKRPTPDEMVQIFADLGLVGDFWDPRSDRFG